MFLQHHFNGIVNPFYFRKYNAFIAILALPCLWPLQVFDDCALSNAVKEEMYKCYPDAKRAHLKRGGNFPYLSKSAEVNVFIQVRITSYSSIVVVLVALMFCLT